ncbi:hypothetical protein V6N13_140182 [Hibiscus sabdariffa]
MFDDRLLKAEIKATARARLVSLARPSGGIVALLRRRYPPFAGNKSVGVEKEEFEEGKLRRYFQGKSEILVYRFGCFILAETNAMC